MKKWLTEIKAICPLTGLIKTYGGDDIESPTFEMAQKWCNENKGYLKVLGELIAEIPCKEGTFEADFSKIIDYEKTQNN